MAKLNDLIEKLSENDYNSIYNLLNETDAGKSAYLLKSMREKQCSDHKIMSELAVNSSAYYTLRSRLNQKIEEYFLEQLNSPRTDMLNKVAGINELIFNQKKTVAVATLKKLEKDLLRYDFSTGLMAVYRALKKLHVNTPDYFFYSQAYNKHVAYMMAADKAENLLAAYFKKYGHYLMKGDKQDKLALQLLVKEMHKLAGLYQSDRLDTYQACMLIFHRLFVAELTEEGIPPTEEIFEKVSDMFSIYHTDSVFYHLKPVFEFLQFAHYEQHEQYAKAEEHFISVNEVIAKLVSNYKLYTYSSQFLLTKIKRNIRLGKTEEMFIENEDVFRTFEMDNHDIPQLILYITYRAISCYYAGKYDEAALWLNNLLNQTEVKKYALATLEIKAILALQYYLMNDSELFDQLMAAIQRQMRANDKQNPEHILVFTKMLKIAMHEKRKDKRLKIKELAETLTSFTVKHFAPTLLIKIDDNFINKLSA